MRSRMIEQAACDIAAGWAYAYDLRACGVRKKTRCRDFRVTDEVDRGRGNGACFSIVNTSKEDMVSIVKGMEANSFRRESCA